MTNPATASGQPLTPAQWCERNTWQFADGTLLADLPPETVLRKKSFS